MNRLFNENGQKMLGLILCCLACLGFGLNAFPISSIPLTGRLFIPFIVGLFGFQLLRGCLFSHKRLDLINQSINPNIFHAVFSLCLLFLLIELSVLVISVLKSNWGDIWKVISNHSMRLLYGNPLSISWEQHIYNTNKFLVLFFVLVMGGFLFPRPYKKWISLYYIFVFPGCLCLLVYVSDVPSGLFLNIFMTVFCFACSLPLGMMCAFGQRSKLYVIRYGSRVFVMLCHAIPFLLVLFIASTLIPLFFPPEAYVEIIKRVLIVVTLFQAGVIAKIVTAGLKSLTNESPSKQDETGCLNRYFMFLEVLKREVFHLGHSFVALFKYTFIVGIIGLFDFLGMARALSQNPDPDWLGFGLIYISVVMFVCWIICYILTLILSRFQVPSRD